MQVANVEEQKACANALRRIQSNRRAKMPETLKAPSNVKLKTKSSSSDSNHPSLVILAKRETRPWMTNGVSFGWLYKYVKT